MPFSDPEQVRGELGDPDTVWGIGLVEIGIARLMVVNTGSCVEEKQGPIFPEDGL